MKASPDGWPCTPEGRAVHTQLSQFCSLFKFLDQNHCTKPVTVSHSSRKCKAQGTKLTRFLPASTGSNRIAGFNYVRSKAQSASELVLPERCTPCGHLGRRCSWRVRPKIPKCAPLALRRAIRATGCSPCAFRMWSFAAEAAASEAVAESTAPASRTYAGPSSGSKPETDQMTVTISPSECQQSNPSTRSTIRNRPPGHNGQKIKPKLSNEQVNKRWN